jgi:signal transduction histidine kinase
MSGVTAFWFRFFMNASFLRTAAETLAVFGLLTLFNVLVYQTSAAEMTVPSMLFFVNPFSALYYSLRLRVPAGRWSRRIGLDLLWLCGIALLLNPLGWLITRIDLLGMYSGSPNVLAAELIFIALLAFPYFFFRCALRFIVWWNDLRQRRVIWSLVSSNLVAVALLQALAALPLTLALFFSQLGDIPFAQVSNSSLAQFLYRLQISLPLVGIVILVATAVLMLLLPVSIVVAYFFARRIRRRLDVLLDAAHTARDGIYGIQIEVTGHDEIARLQGDFNAMTTSLKTNIDALRSEREKVAALLATRRELMANVSHELRTPIATVRAYLDSALRQHGHTGDVMISHNDLEIIQRETLRLQTLIDDLFALSRAEVDQLAIRTAPVDAAALIQRMIETVAPLAWQVNRVEFVSNIPAWLPKVLADAPRLEQVLRNLIHNSLRYTPPGGLVIVSAQETPDAVEIQVKDTGQGIDPEHLPHIWDRYYRDSENGGTGIGLALVKSFIEAMHGQVSAVSTPGEGSCFTITLPRAAIAEEVSTRLAKPQPVPRQPPRSSTVIP